MSESLNHCTLQTAYVRIKNVEFQNLRTKSFFFSACSHYVICTKRFYRQLTSRELKIRDSIRKGMIQFSP